VKARQIQARIKTHIFKTEGDNHWTALPKEVMDSPTTDGFTSRLDVFLEDNSSPNTNYWT